jgi:hypothetical protein
MKLDPNNPEPLTLTISGRHAYRLRVDATRTDRQGKRLFASAEDAALSYLEATFLEDGFRNAEAARIKKRIDYFNTLADLAERAMVARPDLHTFRGSLGEYREQLAKARKAMQ